MATTQIVSKPLGQPPSIGSWIHTGKNSRARHNEVKDGLLREEMYSIDRR